MVAHAVGDPRAAIPHAPGPRMTRHVVATEQGDPVVGWWGGGSAIILVRGVVRLSWRQRGVRHLAAGATRPQVRLARRAASLEGRHDAEAAAPCD